MPDGRQVHVDFKENNGQTHVHVAFDPESQNPEEMQKGGWQAILDNFKKVCGSQLKIFQSKIDIKLDVLHSAFIFLGSEIFEI